MKWNYYSYVLALKSHMLHWVASCISLFYWNLFLLEATEIRQNSSVNKYLFVFRYKTHDFPLASWGDGVLDCLLPQVTWTLLSMLCSRIPPSTPRTRTPRCVLMVSMAAMLQLPPFITFYISLFKGFSKRQQRSISYFSSSYSFFLSSLWILNLMDMCVKSNHGNIKDVNRWLNV